MRVTDIIPCIKVTKDNNMDGTDMYIDMGAKVKIIDFDGNIIKGQLLVFDFGEEDENDDILLLAGDNEEEIGVRISDIEDIEVLR